MKIFHNARWSMGIWSAIMKNLDIESATAWDTKQATYRTLRLGQLWWYSTFCWARGMVVLGPCLGLAGDDWDDMTKKLLEHIEFHGIYIYPLVIADIANWKIHYYLWENPLYMVIFNSKLSVYQRVYILYQRLMALLVGLVVASLIQRIIW